MYTKNIGLILGFHGCGKVRAMKAVLNEEGLRPSDKPYDWRGNGIYFWDRDDRRALEFAIEKESSDPSVVGAVIDPGICLDLRCREGLETLRMAYDHYCSIFGTPMAENSAYSEGVPLKRDLDCLIIETACVHYLSDSGYLYDTVIGTFFEGTEVYPGAGMRNKTHTQICVRNPNNILGYFLPRRHSR